MSLYKLSMFTVVEKKEVTLTRLRFGKCFVNEYLALINRADTDKSSILL